MRGQKKNGRVGGGEGDSGVEKRRESRRVGGGERDEGEGRNRRVGGGREIMEGAGWGRLGWRERNKGGW